MGKKLPRFILKDCISFERNVDIFSPHMRIVTKLTVDVLKNVIRLWLVKKLIKKEMGLLQNVRGNLGENFRKSKNLRQTMH